MIKIAKPHFDFESKKDYTKPIMKVVQLQHQSYLLDLSDTRTKGLGSNNLNYDKNGGDQEDAW